MLYYFCCCWTIQDKPFPGGGNGHGAPTSVVLLVVSAQEISSSSHRVKATENKHRNMQTCKAFVVFCAWMCLRCTAGILKIPKYLVVW